MSPRRRGSGRKEGTERIRELVSVLASLSKEGTQVSVDALGKRLGISRDEAQRMMEIIIQASGEETSGLLISANDDMTEFTLEYSTVRGRPIRLNDSETIALIHALDQAGIDDEDPIRTRLRRAFSSPEVFDSDVRQSLGAPFSNSLHETLSTCAAARAEGRMMSFLYQGVADVDASPRCVLVRRLHVDQNSWYVDAYDLDRLADRTFRIDRMSGASLGPHGRLPTHDNENAPVVREVAIRFFDPTMLTVFDWPGLRITKRSSSCIDGCITYYGEHSDWLIRRITACGGSATVDDERIMYLAREYAKSLLRNA